MEEKKYIGQLFDRIAGTYDKLNHLLSLNIDRRWRRKAVRKLTPCRNLLDVAVGTADLTIEILRQNKAPQVVGLDLSVEMMRVGIQKVARKGFSEQVRFDQGSAMQMPYGDASFEAVSCAYGVRNFEDMDQGLREMCRVLSPGGQLIILEFSYPENWLIRKVYDFYFSKVLPAVGRLVSKDKEAYSYLNKSVKDFLWGEEMKQHLEQAGFRDVRYNVLTFGITTIYTAKK